jgi:hypothetical protein
MTTKTTSKFGFALIQFLQREGAKETWYYERIPILLVEAACVFAAIWAAPNRLAALLLLVDMPRSIYAAELARRSRSGASRKAELAEAMKLPQAELTCQRDLDIAARNNQIMTAAVPLVALAMSVAASGGTGLTRAAVVGFVTSIIRFAMIEGYGYWRKWYRQQVPCVVPTKHTDQAKIAASLIDIAGLVERLSDEHLANNTLQHSCAELAGLIAARLRKMTRVLPSPASFRRNSAAEEFEVWRPTEGRLTECLQAAFDEYGDNARICARAVEDFLRECVANFSGRPASGDSQIYESAALLETIAAMNRDLVRIADHVASLSGEQLGDIKAPKKLAEEIIRQLLALKLKSLTTGLPPEAQHLATTTPFNSGAIAKAVEEVRRSGTEDGSNG